MLVLTRRPGEAINIGDDVRVVLVRARDGSARIGIEAPPALLVLRGELVERNQTNERRNDNGENLT